MNQERQLIAACAASLQEAACPQLRRLLLGQLQQASKDQYELLEQMRQKGYYPDRDVTGAELRRITAEFKSMQGGTL
jgi:spore coat protein CotF